MILRRAIRPLALALAILPPPTAAQEPGAPGRLGTVHFPVSCSPRAQAAFDRAMALLHHMTYPQARASFQQIAEQDPRCAMARWGYAMTLFQPLWPTRPSPEDIRAGGAALREARALDPPTERERLYLEAGEAFFGGSDSTEYWHRIRRWRQAMARVHAAYPADPEAAVWLALAELATAPGAALLRQHADRAAGLLLGVHRRIPDHPGAMHYLIHANDTPGRERGSPDVVRRYTAVAPRNPHALHMPTHIHTRLGAWEEVIRGNLAAAEAALEHPAGDAAQYVWDEFPHAVEYLVYAYLQRGEDREALAQLRRLRRTESLEPTFKTAFHLASAAARYELERRDWKGAMAVLPRDPPWLEWDRFAWPEAITRFARGLGMAHAARLDEARAEAGRITALEGAADRSGEPLFARQIGVLRLLLDGWVAHAAGHPDSGATLVRRAAALETGTPKHAVTPAPTLPAHELLGDMLLEQRRPAEALEAYRRSLALYPNRLNSVLGAARAAAAAGKAAEAATFYRRLVELAGGGSRPAIVREAGRPLEQRSE